MISALRILSIRNQTKSLSSEPKGLQIMRVADSITDMSEQPKQAEDRKEADRAANLAIGKRLQLIRIHRKLTQGELAERINYKQSRVSSWENGKDGMYAFQLALIAKALGVTADMILDVDNSEPPTEGEFRFLEEARRIGFDPAWRSLVKYGEPAKRIGSLGESSSED